MYPVLAGIAGRRGATCTRNRRSRGVILVVVMIVMLVLTVLMSGLWTLRTQDGVEGGRNVASVAAFWAAEAGLHDALLRLNTNSSYQSSPTNFTGATTNGLYAVAVTATSPSNYLIVSTGTVGSSFRIVQQTTITSSQQWSAAFNYAISGYGGTGYINLNPIITGNVYDAGPLSIIGNSVVKGIVYGNNVSGSGTYTNQPPPNPPPGMPGLDTSYYNSQLALAALVTPKTQNYTTLNLSGGTVYVNGNVTNSAAINGPGTLVATGNIVIQKNAVVSSNITIISGAVLSLYDNVIVKTYDTLYATLGVSLNNNGINISHGAILTPGDINTYQNFTFSGIMYAGGNFAMNQNGVINGSVVSGNNITVLYNSRITYDPSQFPPLPIGLGDPAGIRKLAWSEK